MTCPGLMLAWYNVLIKVKQAMDPIHIRLTLNSLNVVRPDQNKINKILTTGMQEAMKLVISETENWLCCLFFSKYLNCDWLSQPKQSATNRLHWANIKLYWPYISEPTKRMKIITADNPAMPGIIFEKPYIKVSLIMVYIEICWCKPVYLVFLVVSFMSWIDTTIKQFGSKSDLTSKDFL